MKPLAVFLLLPLALLSQGASPFSAAGPSEGLPSPVPLDLEITEWEVPWENTRPQDPAVDGSGNAWFVGQRGDYIARLDPASGEFTRFDLSEDAGPQSLIVDGEGNVWYAGNRGAHIGRLDPGTGEVSTFPMPSDDARDPHTLALDGRGHIWFTLQGSNMVGRLTMADGHIELIPMHRSSSRPYGIAVDASGRPWFGMLGVNRIGTVDPETLELDGHEMPAAGARARRVVSTESGRIWYVDWTRGQLGRFDPAAGSFREWAGPAGPNGRPGGLTSDHRGRLWFVESGPSPARLVGFDPSTERFFSIEALEEGAVGRIVAHAASRELWFGTGGNTIARVRLD
jgi:virginiamycin B lyase